MNKQTIRDFLLPTPVQIFWSVAGAVFITLAVYHQSIVDRIAHGNSVPLDIVGNTFKAQLANLNQYPAVQTAVIVAFWALVGLCTFGVYAAIRNNGSNVMDEVTIQREYTNTSKSVSRFTWLAVRIGAAVAFLIAVQIMWHVGFGFWFGMIERFVLGGISIGSTINLLLGLAGLSLSFYAMFVLIHVAMIAESF